MDEALFDKLQLGFRPGSEVVSATVTTGIVALERRSSGRRNWPLPGSRAQMRSSAISDHEGRAHASSSPPAWSSESDSGLRSTASSPGPGRLDIGFREDRPTPPLLTRRRAVTRPPSELFIQTPVAPPLSVPQLESKPRMTTRMTWRPQSELFLPTPRDPSKRMTVFRTPSPDAATGIAEEEEKQNDNEPATVPISPISAAMARYRFSRLDVHTSVRQVIDSVDIVTEPMARASTAPPLLHRTLSGATTRSTYSLRSVRAGGSSARGAGIRPGARLSAVRAAKNRGTMIPAGIEKDVAAVKRSSALSAKRQTGAGAGSRSGRATRRDSKLEDRAAANADAASSTTPIRALQKKPTLVMPWRRRPRGETMSMLLDAGFFPVNEYIYNAAAAAASTSEASGHVPPPLRTASKKSRMALSILVRDISAGGNSPLSIIGTPTSFYHHPLGLPGSPRRHIRGSLRRSMAVRRRVMGQLLQSQDLGNPTKSPYSSIVANSLQLSPLPSPRTPSTPTSALSALMGGVSPLLLPLSPPEPSPGVLEVIPENGPSYHEIPRMHSPVLASPPPDLTTSEPANIFPSSTTPMKTEIHLPSGTVLTVCPPELTARTRTLYIQGPIRLPAPAVAPRRDSIASLAPFQSAMDSIYDAALLFPRRASEDRVVDDVLDWYGGWGFGIPSFAFDEFSVHGYGSTDRLSGMTAVVTFAASGDGGDWDIDAGPTPVDQAVAARMLGGGRGLHVPPKPLSILGLTAEDLALQDPASLAYGGGSLPTSSSAWLKRVGPSSSPAKSSFSMLGFGTRRPSAVGVAAGSHSGDRKISFGGSSRKGSGYALSPLPEDGVLGPLKSGEEDVAVEESPNPRSTPTPMSRVTKAIGKQNSFDWDGEIEETSSGRPSWFLGSGSHGNPIAEIKRKESVASASSNDTASGSSYNEGAGDGYGGENGTKRKPKVKGKDHPVMRVRRFVAGAGAIL